ncbi:MAG: hypothetical protein ABIF40_00095 [archaeon]
MVQNNYTIEDIYKVAGEDLTRKMLGLIDNEEDLISWFYSPNKFFDKKSPYDVLQEDPSKLEKVIMDILTAAQGG